MAGQRIVAGCIIGGVVVVGEGRERHFRIDDDIPVVGEVQDNIGDFLASRLLVAHGLSALLEHHLLLILHALLKPHVLKECGESQLPEIALRLRFPGEGGREFVGTLSQGLCLLLAGLDGGAQVLHRGQPVLVALLHALPHLFQTLMEGIEQKVELLLVGDVELLGAFLQDVLRHRIDLLADELRLAVHLFFLLLPQLVELPVVLPADFVLLPHKFLSGLVELGLRGFLGSAGRREVNAQLTGLVPELSHLSIDTIEVFLQHPRFGRLTSAAVSGIENAAQGTDGNAQENEENIHFLSP